MFDERIIERFRVDAGEKFHLKDHDPGWTGSDVWKELGEDELKERARELLARNIAELSAEQEKLYADNQNSILIVLQAMDAAGKDGTIKHVMSGVNPMGCQVFSFKKPTPEEFDHTFLWRYMRCVPERGRIGLFNRSYYEDVLIVKVHPELLGPHVDHANVGKKFWKQRYEDINAFEEHLARNGTVVLKFFLHVSKKEQKKRFLERLDRPEKNWKFSAADVTEREFWPQYMDAYEEAIAATSTKHVPWHVIPADHKWVTRAAVAGIVTAAMRGLNLKFPDVGDEGRRQLADARRKLEEE